MKIVIWDVDTQNDFFDSDFEYEGKVYKPQLGVPGAGSIRSNLKELLTYASSNPNYRIMGSVDAHTDADVKHFAKWPKHCKIGTPGQLKIEETNLENTGYVPMEKLSDDRLGDLIYEYQGPYDERQGPLYFEKSERKEDLDPDACNSARVNPNVAPILEKLEPKVIAVCGVALGYCVKEAVEYFLELGYKVALVTDAIKEFSADELALYSDWKARGAYLVHTRDVLAGKLEELVK